MQLKKWGALILSAILSFSVSASALDNIESNNYGHVNDSSIASFNQSPIPSSTSTTDTRTWQHPSRSRNTAYWNHTGRTIIVSVATSGQRWEQAYGYVNGVVMAAGYSGDFGGGSTFTLEVPHGQWYQVNTTNPRGHPHGIKYWAELR